MQLASIPAYFEKKGTINRVCNLRSAEVRDPSSTLTIGFTQSDK